MANSPTTRIDDDPERCAELLTTRTGLSWQKMREGARPVYASGSAFILHNKVEPDKPTILLIRRPHPHAADGPAWAVSTSVGDCFDVTAPNFDTLLACPEAVAILSGRNTGRGWNTLRL